MLMIILIIINAGHKRYLNQFLVSGIQFVINWNDDDDGVRANERCMIYQIR